MLKKGPRQKTPLDCVWLVRGAEGSRGKFNELMVLKRLGFIFLKAPGVPASPLHTPAGSRERPVAFPLHTLPPVTDSLTVLPFQG